MTTILVVEDEIEIQNILKIVLQDIGYKVISALTLEEAERAFELHSFDIDVYLVDRNLGTGITTDELVENIRKSNPSIPIIAFSADGDARKQQIKLGCSDELEKPVGLDKIIKFFTSLKKLQ
jgi:DNA-binding NtrC family response regulator